MSELPDLPRRAWSPEVHEALVDLLQHPPSPSPVAVLDWDDTVIAGDISLALLRDQDRRNGTDWHDTYFRLLEAYGRDVAYPQITRWFAGHTPESFAAIARTLVDEALLHGEVHWREEMVDLVAAAHHRGWEVWVVTASPAVVVREMARRIGIPDERVLGMSLVLGEDGRFRDEIVEPATYCAGKARAVELHIGRKPDLVVGDSRSDADMMGLAHHALLLHGHDVDLLAEARQRGWWVQGGWKHTPAEPGVRVKE